MDIFSKLKPSSPFKERTPLEKRKLDSKNIMNRYPGRIPIICEKYHDSDDSPELTKSKYLVPSDLTFGQFLFVIRKRLKLTEEKALFVFINNTLVPSSEIISKIYNNHKDEDGYLYVSYSFENTFG